VGSRDAAAGQPEYELLFDDQIEYVKVGLGATWWGVLRREL
jgi:hypothetical protein